MVRFAKDYELSDVVAVYDQGPWGSWSDVVDWLKTDGIERSGLALGELARMIADFGVLAGDSIPFATDPGVAYELAQEHRRTAAVQAALHWIESLRLREQENSAETPRANSTQTGETRRSA